MTKSARPWGIARVHGRSMLPTLNPDDRLLVRYGVVPRPGDLVVVRFPDGVIAIKRAGFRDESGTWPGWWVERDNPAEGVDSALVGTIPDADVLAVALLRVWPRPRILRNGSARHVT